MIVIPFGSQVLALTEGEFQAAIERGREFMACGPEQTSEPLLNVDEASRATGIPKQSLWQAAREGTIPHHRVGRSVRFALSEIKQATYKQGTQSYPQAGGDLGKALKRGQVRAVSAFRAGGHRAR